MAAEDIWEKSCCYRPFVNNEVDLGIINANKGKSRAILIFTTRTKLRLVVDLQENVKAQENLAYALKVKISNLQKMAETLVWEASGGIKKRIEQRGWI